MDPLVATLLEPFIEFPFMRRALVATLALSLGCAPIGCVLVLPRMGLGAALALVPRRPGWGRPWPSLRTLHRHTTHKALPAFEDRVVCYSAQVRADYRHFVREYGAVLDIEQFCELFWRRSGDSKLRIPKAMEAAFAQPRSEAESQIKAAIDTFAAAQAVKLQQDLFKQRKRLAQAQRTLQAKPTRAAAQSQRIATDKIAWALGKLSDLRRSELEDRDSRIFPGHYAPVMVMEHGRRVIKPMRYQCRPAGQPVSCDSRYPGTYNARRDNLEGFWRSLFGHTHGIAVIHAFYENVNRHRVEGRELGPGEAAENVVLEFKPRPVQDMLVACLWSRWTAPGQPDLLSFAAITDAPPPEVAAAGHDRCIIPIRPEHIDAWLNPDPADLSAQYAILDDRARPFYEHRMAA